MRYSIFILILLISKNFKCQTSVNETQIDSIKKYKLIYTAFTEIFSTTINNSTGKSLGGTSRSMSIDFKVGIDGSWKNIGKKGKKLRKIIKNDSTAMKYFNEAYLHLKKKRLYNSLEYLGYVVAVGSAIPLFMGGDRYEDEGVTPLLVAGIIGEVTAFAGIWKFHNLTDNEMDKWKLCISKAIDIYNENLIKDKK